MNMKCIKWQCIIGILAVTANIALIILALVLFNDAHGSDRIVAALLLLPPILSLIALRRGPDKEERKLKSRLRKANLRKELKELEEFDNAP